MTREQRQAGRLHSEGIEKKHWKKTKVGRHRIPVKEYSRLVDFKVHTLKEEWI